MSNNGDHEWVKKRHFLSLTGVRGLQHKGGGGGSWGEEAGIHDQSYSQEKRGGYPQPGAPPFLSTLMATWTTQEGGSHHVPIAWL